MIQIYGLITASLKCGVTDLLPARFSLKMNGWEMLIQNNIKVRVKLIGSDKSVNWTILIKIPGFDERSNKSLSQKFSLVWEELTGEVT
jgi:hypothetical protein